MIVAEFTRSLNALYKQDFFTSFDKSIDEGINPSLKRIAEVSNETSKDVTTLQTEIQYLQTDVKNLKSDNKNPLAE